MTPIDICILLLRSAHQIVDWHGVRAAEQMLINALDSHPDLPWKIAIHGLADEDPRFNWAKRVLVMHTLLNDGNAA